MHFFQYKGKKLFAEDTDIAQIASDVGTPFYLYSYKTLIRHYNAFENGVKLLPHMVCYSVKANSNITILKIFINKGWGLDIVSGGELYRALMSGCPPNKIVFSGVGKTDEEIRRAIQAGILMFNVESSQELEEIHKVANHIGEIARISLMVNPDIDPETHPYIATGLFKNKFGIPYSEVKEIYKKANNLSNIEVVGISCHIGSQIIQLQPFIDAFKKLKELYFDLKKMGIEIKYIDLGGGLGIPYKEEEKPPHPEEYGSNIAKEASDVDATFIFEPGRVIVGNAGVLITRVLFTKDGADRRFVVVDAGMNDLIRPSLYNSFHQVLPVIKKGGKETVSDLVGPICETGDFFAKNRKMPNFEKGDLVAILGAGAYGFSMSSNYNSRPRIPEILVKEDKFWVIRVRESEEDLIRGENIPDHFKEEQ